MQTNYSLYAKDVCAHCTVHQTRPILHIYCTIMQFLHFISKDNHRCNHFCAFVFSPRQYNSFHKILTIIPIIIIITAMKMQMMITLQLIKSWKQRNSQID